MYNLRDEETRNIPLQYFVPDTPPSWLLLPASDVLSRQAPWTPRVQNLQLGSDWQWTLHLAHPSTPTFSITRNSLKAYWVLGSKHSGRSKRRKEGYLQRGTFAAFFLKKDPVTPLDAILGVMQKNVCNLRRGRECVPKSDIISAQILKFWISVFKYEWLFVHSGANFCFKKLFDLRYSYDANIMLPFHVQMSLLCWDIEGLLRETERLKPLSQSYPFPLWNCEISTRFIKGMNKKKFHTSTMFSTRGDGPLIQANDSSCIAVFQPTFFSGCLVRPE